MISVFACLPLLPFEPHTHQVKYIIIWFGMETSRVREDEIAYIWEGSYNQNPFTIIGLLCRPLNSRDAV